eukprot:gene2360-2911_t
MDNNIINNNNIQKSNDLDINSNNNNNNSVGYQTTTTIISNNNIDNNENIISTSSSLLSTTNTTITTSSDKSTTKSHSFLAPNLIFDDNDPFASKRYSGFVNTDSLSILHSQLNAHRISTNNKPLPPPSPSSSLPSTPERVILGLDQYHNNHHHQQQQTSLLQNSTSSTSPSSSLNTSPLSISPPKSDLSTTTTTSSTPTTNATTPPTPIPNNSELIKTSLLHQLEQHQSIINENSTTPIITSGSLGSTGSTIFSDNLSTTSSSSVKSNKIDDDDSSSSEEEYELLAQSVSTLKLAVENEKIVHILELGDESFDINLWDEELYQSSSPTSINTVRFSKSNQPVEKGRSSTVYSNSYIMTASLSISSPNNGSGNNSNTTTATTTTNKVSVPNNNIVLMLNNVIRKLTPISSVPPTNEVTDFIDCCHLFPTRLLIRKLIQRYLVPREVNGKLNDTEWQKIVERPVQLRVGKILRKVVDNKKVVFDFPTLLLVKTFIKGYLQQQSEMARGLNLSLQKKILSKTFEISSLSEGLLKTVLRNLDLKSLCVCVRVCKKWNKIIDEGSIWEHLYIKLRNVLNGDNDEKDINIWEDPTLNCPDGPLYTPQPQQQQLHHHSPQTNNIVSPILLSTSPTAQQQSQTQQPQPLPPLPPRPPSLDLPALEFTGINSAPSTPSSTTPSTHSENSSPSPLSPSISAISTNNNNESIEHIQQQQQQQHKPVQKFINLNQLVEKITSITSSTDQSEINAVLATYRNFVTTRQLVSKLLQRFHVPRPQSVLSVLDWRMKHETPVQIKVCKVLKKLIDDHFSDFDDVVLTVLKIFLRHIVDKNSPFTNHLIRSFSKKILTDSQTTNNEKLKNKASRSQSKIGLRMMSVRKPQFTDILNIPADEIAKQLTLIEFDIYSKIQTNEFINQAWAKEKTRHLAPNIRAAIDRFNLVTKWVCTIILKEEKIRTRTKIVSKILKIAKILRSYSNYHTLMALLSGLNEAPIFRLKHTLSELKPKVQKISSELQTMMSVENNHDNYRTELSSVDSKQSCIPYLGVYLKDITFFQEDCDKGSGVGTINMKQSKNVYSVMKIIQNFQKNPYNFEEFPKVKESLLNLSVLEEDTLFHLSLLREPRGCKRSDLI